MTKEEKQIYDKAYYLKNKGLSKEEKQKEREKKKLEALNKKKNRLKEWKLNNKDKIKAYEIKRKEQRKTYIKENREKIREYDRLRQQRKRLDPLYRLKGNLRTMLRKALILNGYNKLSKTEQILGCSYEEFKHHIESQFESWMNWDNYGLYNSTLNYGWDIDHIVPLSSATCEADMIKLNHYTNLQPLCSYVNRNIKKDLI